MQVNVRLPSDWRGKPVHLRWNSSSEAMLFDNFGNVLQVYPKIQFKKTKVGNDKLCTLDEC